MAPDRPLCAADCRLVSDTQFDAALGV